jgi:hypothetical protein
MHPGGKSAPAIASHSEAVQLRSYSGNDQRLRHQLGCPVPTNSAGWYVSNQINCVQGGNNASQGAVQFGPYETLAPGHYTVGFTLSISDNASDSAPVARLDVVRDGQPFQGAGSLVITRDMFATTSVVATTRSFQTFIVPFDVPQTPAGGLDRLEFRVVWLAPSPQIPTTLYIAQTDLASGDCVGVRCACSNLACGTSQGPGLPLPSDGRARLQACIDETPPGGVLLLPRGCVITIGGQVNITKSMTLTTEGLEQAASNVCAPPDPTGGTKSVIDSTRCATIRADPSLNFVEAFSTDPYRVRRDHDSRGVSGMIVVAPPQGGTSAPDGYARLNAPGAPTLSGVSIHHLIIDGQGQARTQYALAQIADNTGRLRLGCTADARGCRACDNDNCSNVVYRNCVDCKFSANASINAGMDPQIDGYGHAFRNCNNLELSNNLFVAAGGRTWVDLVDIAQTGAAGQTARVLIDSNRFYDGTNGSLVLSVWNMSKLTGEVSRNQIAQPNQDQQVAGIFIFAGNAGQFGDASQRVQGPGGVVVNTAETLWVRNNAVHCDRMGQHGCPAGILLGVQGFPLLGTDFQSAPWSYRGGGGRIEQNHVEGARIGINIDGLGMNAGTFVQSNTSYVVPLSPVYVIGNLVRNSTIPFNRAPEPGCAPASPPQSPMPSTHDCNAMVANRNLVATPDGWQQQVGVMGAEFDGWFGPEAPSYFSRNDTSNASTPTKGYPER